jgi:hypothetical protein
MVRQARKRERSSSLALAVPRNGLCRIGGQRLYGDHDFLERLHDTPNLALLGHCHRSPLKLDMRSSQIVVRRLTLRVSCVIWSASGIPRQLHPVVRFPGAFRLSQVPITNGTIV